MQFPEIDAAKEWLESKVGELSVGDLQHFDGARQDVNSEIVSDIVCAPDSHLLQMSGKA